MADRLVIEIDGNATGLTRELGKAESRLTTFNKHVSLGNRALTGFTSKIGTSTNAITRLTASTSTLNTSIKATNRSFNSVATSVTRLGTASKGASTSMGQAGRSANQASGHLTKLATSGKAVNALFTSMGRRMGALNATISSLNTALRGVTRNIQRTGTVTGGTTTIINRYSAAARGSAAASGMAAAGAMRLTGAQITLAESFRRSVAQITAFRTLTYQAAFWFAPLVYSIVKVNSEYEKQKILLANISNASTEAAKKQEAMQSINYLRDLSMNAPFNMEAITDAFVKMRVGGIEPTNGSLQTLLDSVAAFGGDSNNLKRAAVAIQQMGGKGTVSMEELRQQLGEHVPTALKAMAKGLGYAENDIGSFYKAVEQRQVSAVKGLTAMFEVLEEENKGKAEKMMNTWSGQIARLQRAWQVALTKITENEGPNSFFATLKENVRQLTDFLNSAQGTEFLKQVQDGLAAVAKAFSATVKFAYEYREILVKLAVAALALMAFKVVVSLFIAFGATILKVVAGTKLLIGAIATARVTMNLFGMALAMNNGALGIFSARGLVAARATGALSRTASLGILSFTRMIPVIGLVLGVLSALVALWGEWRNYQQGDIKNLDAISEKFGDTAGTAKMYYLEAREARLAQNNLTTSMVKGKDGAMVLKGASEALTKQILAQGAASQWAALQTAKAFRVEKWAKLSNAQEDMQQAREAANKNKSGGYSSVGMSNDTRFVARRSAYLTSLGEFKDAAAAEQRLQAEFDNIMNPTVPVFDTPDYVEPKPLPSKGGDANKGSQSNSIEGTVNAAENAIVRYKELQQQFSDIKNNTDTVFDAEAAQEFAEKMTQGLDREQLQILRREYETLTKEMEKMIKVENAIIDVNDKMSDTLATVAMGYAKLDAGYESIALASEEYQLALEREKREELAIVEAKIASGKATEEQIAQYEKLKLSILDATRAKQAELVLNAASDANKNSEDYRKSFLSEGQIRQEELAEEMLRLNEALSFIDNNPASDARVAIADAVDEANRRLTEARQQLADAQSSNNQEAIDEANALIIVRGEELSTTMRINDELAKGIPYLEERRKQIELEAKARAKWGGAGGPLLDWARDGQKAFDNLGESMGGLLVSQFDELTNSFIEGKLAFGDFVKTMLAGLIKIIIQGLLAKAILSALGMGPMTMPTTSDGSGMGAILNTNVGYLVGGNHGGGIAGSEATFHRVVNPSMFSFAQRYHTGGIVGLGPNEVPIIAEKGEGVFTKEQMKSMGSASGGGNNVEVNVINQTGTEAEVHREGAKFDGEKWVENIILKKMSRPGPIRDTMAAMSNKR